MAKKNFDTLVNPALQFMSDSATEEPASEKKGTVRQDGNAPRLGRPKSVGQTKSKPLTCRVYPSVYEDLRKIAAMKRTSTNEIINNLLRDYTKKHQDTIDKYNKIFEQEEKAK